MKMYLSIQVVLSYLFIFVHSALPAKIPPGTKGCKRDDPKFNDCIVKTANTIIPAIIDGMKEYDIPVLDPFEIKSVTISERRNQGLDLDLKLHDVNLVGITHLRLADGTKIDLDKGIMEMKLDFPVVRVEGQYTMDGKLLLLPIKGAGEVNFTFSDLLVSYDANITVLTKNGKEYMQMVDPKVVFTAKHFYIYLGNLFNGDQKIGEQMNTFLNEHWQDFLTELGPAFGETMKTILYTVWNRVALKVPYNVLFPK